MSLATETTANAVDVIAELTRLAAMAPNAVPADATQTARHSLFDTLVVLRAGTEEPVARAVRQMVLAEAGAPAASIAGSVIRVPPRAAALANGTAAHALDYDDTHFGHVGHVSVAVLPAALAVGEAVDAPASAVLHAFTLGAEAACRVGQHLGRAHYVAGFHQTGTSGAFGAAVAAGILLGLDAAALRNALSLVSTRASGLKSQFGTFGKPFHAGVATSNGVEAAVLAAAGFISADDGYGGPQGFCATHAGEADDSAFAMPPERGFLFTQNQYKLHACCHGTHAMLEALGSLDIGARGADRITVRTNPRWLSVCDIKRPRTALELKFSYAALAGAFARGFNTADPAAYTVSAATDPATMAIAERVDVVADDSVPDTACEVRVTFGDGETASEAHDLAAPMAPEHRFAKLEAKARAVIGDGETDTLLALVGVLDAKSAKHLGGFIAR